MRRVSLLLAFAFATLIVAWPAYAGQAPGNSGRPLKIYGATFSSTFTIYALSPDILAGWNGPLREYEKQFIPKPYQDLPVLGGWYGNGFFPDREVLVSAGLDNILLLTADTDFTASIEKALTDIGLPFLSVRGLYLDDYASMFRTIGTAFTMPERGEALAAHIEGVLERGRAVASGVPADQRLRVYLAHDPDGLGTVCAGSNRSELLIAAGGVNVHACPDIMGKESTTRVSFEQVMAYDPDVVIAIHPSFINNVDKDGKWKNLRAVRQGRLCKAPREPFAWVDKPSTFMRVVALPWFACTLYPERCTVDLVKETHDFMDLFFSLDLDEATVDAVLHP